MKRTAEKRLGGPVGFFLRRCAGLAVIMAWISYGGMPCRGEAVLPENTIWVSAAAAGSTEADGTRDRPYATLAAGLKHLRPGGTLVVREGIYRESIRLPGGQADSPTVLTAAPGERVIISGMRPVGGWKKGKDGRYRTTIPGPPPKRLFTGVRELPRARQPNEGWFKADSVEQEKDWGRLVAATAAWPSRNLPGGSVTIWAGRSNTFFTMPIRTLDPAAGRVDIDITNRWLKLRDGDKFALVNHPLLIDEPGEWSALAKDGVCHLEIQPESVGDLDDTQIPGQASAVLLVAETQHVRIEGLDVIGGARFGIEVRKSADVEIRSCRVYLNGNYGIGLRDCRDSRVVNNLVIRNDSTGVVLHGCRSIQVTENEIAWNWIDGLVLCWDTHDVEIRHNYLHHHLFWGHPDNVQMFRDVSRVKMIENLLLAAGQTVMTEQASELEFRGNMFVGCIANMLIFGHGSTRDCVVRNNTFAYPGYSCMALTAKNYTVIGNLFLLGHKGVFFSLRDCRGYRGDYNLFRAPPNVEAGIPDREGWHTSVAAFRRHNPGLEVHSLTVNPRLRAAPLTFGVLDADRLHECTRQELFLRGGVDGRYRPGDVVDINFAGVPHRITAVTKASIRLDPPLKRIPLTSSTVANWGPGGHSRLDLRPQPDSPLTNGGPEGGRIGSTLDIQAFRRADFDGDGTRDVPSYPPHLADWEG